MVLDCQLGHLGINFMSKLGQINALLSNDRDSGRHSSVIPPFLPKII